MRTTEEKPPTPDTVRGHINNARCALLAMAQQLENGSSQWSLTQIAEQVFQADGQLRAALDVFEGKVPPPPDVLEEYERRRAAQVDATGDLLRNPTVRAALARIDATRGKHGTET